MKTTLPVDLRRFNLSLHESQPSFFVAFVENKQTYKRLNVIKLRVRHSHAARVVETRGACPCYYYKIYHFLGWEVSFFLMFNYSFCCFIVIIIIFCVFPKYGTTIFS